MADSRIKAVRQFCVSVMVLCLTFFLVSVIQDMTGAQAVLADGLKAPSSETEGQVQQTGNDVLLSGGHGSAEVEGSPWSRIFGSLVPEIATQQGDACVLVRKNGAVLEKTSEDLLYRKLTLRFRGTVSDEDIYRVSGDGLYTGMPVVPVVIIPEEYKNVPLVREPKTPDEDLLLSLGLSEKNGITEAVLEFNSVYEATVTEDEEFYYISLVRPHEKYDKIVVIDAGHGGQDTGTNGGGVDESDVNLNVVKYVKELMDAQTEWKVYYTRLSDTMIELSPRVEFINALHADMIISVHCNSHPLSTVNGVEVMYSEKQGTGDTLNSRYLADLCTSYVAEETGLKRRPLVERSSNLHIIKYCTMPMALIEFGFMSNNKDLAILTTDQAQRNCATAIYRVVEEAYRVLEQPES